MTIIRIIIIRMTRLDMQGKQSDDYHHDCWRCCGCIVMIISIIVTLFFFIYVSSVPVDPTGNAEDA